MMKKTAIVTGGSRGIGFGIVRQLGLDGYNVAVMDVNDPAGYRENFDELKRLGIDYLYVQGSTTNREDPGALPGAGGGKIWGYRRAGEQRGRGA